MLALFLLTCKEALKLKLAFGGTSGRRGNLDLNVRDEVEEDTKIHAVILARGWWDHSLGERTPKEDQDKHGIDKFGFGYVDSQRSKN